MFSKSVSRFSIFFFFRWVSLGLIFLAVGLSVIQLVTYSRIRNTFTPGMMIAGVPVGGLSNDQAAQKLVEAYGLPVELHYQNAIIQVKPVVMGFELDLTAMLTAADLQRVNQPFWQGFWAYLWNQLTVPPEVPLTAKINEDRMRAYLKSEIAPRYDTLPTASMPVPGSVTFTSGTPGAVLDIDRAVVLIEGALRSPVSRVVNLTYNQVNPTRPSLVNLQVLMQQIMDLSGMDGLVAEIYFLDLQSGQELNFAYDTGSIIPPGIAFTAASTVKIPIMVSTFRRVSEPTPKEITDMIELMVERSENDPADQLMERIMASTLGPLFVTDDMQSLGFVDTFMAGYFYPGAPLLERIDTPANLRTDVYTNPDIYNQTTPAEIGQLLADIYTCAERGDGTLPLVFPKEISQSECKTMISYMQQNRIGVLIQAGLPDGTPLAHKHGWITEADGYIHTIGDVGIVYSPAGNYVLSIYMYQPGQLVWDDANLLTAKLSEAVYNYNNQPSR